MFTLDLTLVECGHEVNVRGVSISQSGITPEILRKLVEGLR